MAEINAEEGIDASGEGGLQRGDQDSRVFSALVSALTILKANRPAPNDQSGIGRFYSVTITQMEIVVAVFETYIILREKFGESTAPKQHIKGAGIST